MIYRDEYGYPVDQTLDGGDSAVRMGIIQMCEYSYEKPPIQILGRILNYNDSKCCMVRHPRQVPWNNPKNFSRDQTMMLVAGLFNFEATYILKKIFYSHMKRFFFAQNSERDFIGTTKYPWPHKVNDPGHTPEWRLFDFADPLLPNHIGALILAGRVYWAYPFLLVCYPWHLFSLLGHSLGNHHEENQMIAECYLYGTLKVYKRIHKKWKLMSWGYWDKRNEIEYHDMLVKLVEGS